MDGGDVEPSVPSKLIVGLRHCSRAIAGRHISPPTKKAPAFTGALLMARSAYFFARVFFAFFAFAAFFAFFAMTTLQVGVGESDFTS